MENFVEIPPKCTAAADPRFAPEIVTRVPPLTLPDPGVTLPITGWRVYMNPSWLKRGLVPDGVVTVTSTTVPSAPDGETAATRLSDSTLKLLAATVPK